MQWAHFECEVSLGFHSCVIAVITHGRRCRSTGSRPWSHPGRASNCIHENIRIICRNINKTTSSESSINNNVNNISFYFLPLLHLLQEPIRPPDYLTQPAHLAAALFVLIYSLTVGYICILALFSHESCLNSSTNCSSLTSALAGLREERLILLYIPQTPITPD